MKVRILPLSTIDDNRTILQEVLRLRKYLEENPIRNIFFINENYVVGTVAYNVENIYVNSELDVTASADDCLIFNNGYVGIIDSIGEQYVTVQGVQSILGEKGDKGDTGNGIASIEKTGTSGVVDTYTITFTNGNTTTFTITNGQGVPKGGYTGQALVKSSDEDYETEWKTLEDNFFELSNNKLINPFFRINQRGSTTISEHSYGVDRWYQKEGIANKGLNYYVLNSLSSVSQFVIDNKSTDDVHILFVGVTYVSSEQNDDVRVRLFKANGDEVTPTGNGYVHHIGIESGAYKIQKVFKFVFYNSNETFYEINISNGTIVNNINIKNAFCYELEYPSNVEVSLQNRPFNVTYEGDEVELQKCLFYFEKVTASGIGTNIYFKNSSLSAFISDTEVLSQGLITYIEKRIIPTIQNIDYIRAGFYQAGLYRFVNKSAVLSTSKDRLVCEFNASLPSNIDKTYTKMGMVLASRSVYADAEIYPS